MVTSTFNRDCPGLPGIQRFTGHWTFSTKSGKVLGKLAGENLN